VIKTLSLGDTGVDVSAVCLGTMHFGNRINPEMSMRLLDAYVEAGGSFLDTANTYAKWIPGFVGGESETLLGKWMQERKNRTHLFIATKVGFDYLDVKRGLRAAQIETECEKSLRRLGTETIDLYYAHKDDIHTPMEETLEAFTRLVWAGKVRYVGSSNFPAWRLAEARCTSRMQGLVEYCCVQQAFTYLRPKPGADFGDQLAANRDLLDYCRTRNVRMLAFSPLLSGAYTRADRSLPTQYLGADSDARMAVLRAVASETGGTPNQVVLAWMLHGEPCVIPLMGVSTIEQMTENLGALALQLSPEQMSRLDTAGA
jgi:aryl-alcohol dehydrogenase-like predicted oxidoreductase